MPNHEEEIPMIPKYQTESMMAHMSWANRNIAIVAIVALVSMVIAIIIFVSGYTARTKDWLNTLAELQRQPAVTEVADGIQQQTPP